MGITSREPGTVRGTAKRPHFSLAFMSVIVQLWTQVFWVISVYFNIRNTLPKFCPFLLGHSVYSSFLVFRVKREDAEIHLLAFETKNEHFWLMYGRTVILKICIIVTILLVHRMDPFT